MSRVTDRQLQSIVDLINTTTGSPFYPCADNGSWAIGSFCLSHAYGGVKLERITDADGATLDVFNSGYGTKQALADQMHAFLAGFRLAKEA